MKKVTKDLEKLGIVNVAKIYRNLTPSELIEHALKRVEGTLSPYPYIRDNKIILLNN